MGWSQVLTLEEKADQETAGGEKASGTERISEAYLYLIMMLPQF